MCLRMLSLRWFCTAYRRILAVQWDVRPAMILFYFSCQMNPNDLGIPESCNARSFQNSQMCLNLQTIIANQDQGVGEVRSRLDCCFSVPKIGRRSSWNWDKLNLFILKWNPYSQIVGQKVFSGKSLRDQLWKNPAAARFLVNTAANVWSIYVCCLAERGWSSGCCSAGNVISLDQRARTVSRGSAGLSVGSNVGHSYDPGRACWLLLNH